MALVSVRFPRGRHCGCALWCYGLQDTICGVPRLVYGVWRRCLGGPRDAQCRGGSRVRILIVTGRRQSDAHSVSFGTDVYIVSHIGIWERLAREPWLFEEVEAGAWTGGGAKSQTLSFLLQRLYLGTYLFSFRARKGVHITYNLCWYDQCDLCCPICLCAGAKREAKGYV